MTETAPTLSKVDLRVGNGFGRAQWGFPWQQGGFKGFTKASSVKEGNGLTTMNGIGAIGTNRMSSSSFNIRMKDWVLAHFGSGIERRSSSETLGEMEREASFTSLKM